jgi:hypothetical protein
MKKAAIWYSIAASLVAAVVYILAGSGVLYAGDIAETGEAPPFIFFVAGAYYVLAAYLLTFEKRWLRITLAVLNALVILIFFQMWSARPDVLTSAAGLGTKIPQFLLETGLIYLIVKTIKQPR